MTTEDNYPCVYCGTRFCVEDPDTFEDETPPADRLCGLCYDEREVARRDDAADAARDRAMTAGCSVVK